MHRNAELIEKFYRAFQTRDGATMAGCYHPEVQFSDPVFTDLKGERAGVMWRMLTERGKDLKVEFRDVRGRCGRRSPLGRLVHVQRHRAQSAQRDRCDVRVKGRPDRSPHGSLRPAPLGRTGARLHGQAAGRHSFLQNKVRGTAAKSLTTTSRNAKADPHDRSLRLPDHAASGPPGTPTASSSIRCRRPTA